MTTLASQSMPGAVRQVDGLLITDWLFLFGVAAAALVAVDPLGLDLAGNPVVKHFALMATVPAVLLTLVGRRLRVPWGGRPRAGGLTSALRPLLLLGCVIVAGSCYARFSMAIQSTFLNVGLYMLLASWCAGAMALYCEDPDALLRSYFRILLAAALVMSGFIVFYFRTREVYHEEIFLVIPLAALFFALPRAPVTRWTGTLFFLLMAWFSRKYTSYIIAAFTMLYLMAIVAYPRLASRPKLYRATITYWAIVGMVVASAAAVAIALNNPSGLPSGNTEYRMHTYAIAWSRFTASPLWGSLFAAEAVEKFTLYGIGVSRNFLPTHSDVMDLLANGGVLAVTLWLWGLARAGRIAYRGLLRPGLLGHRWAPYGHLLAVMSVAAILTYAFNPILLQPALAYFVWTNFGLLVGLSLRAHADA